MVKFGERLEKNEIVEWRSYYIDYNELKEVRLGLLAQTYVFLKC